MAHAAGGCLVGALQKQCEAGAIGAVVGEVIAELLPQPDINTLSSEEYAKQRQLLVDQAKLATAVVMTTAGYDIADINTAVKSAETAVQNNHNAEYCQQIGEETCTDINTRKDNVHETGNTSFRWLKQVFENIVSPNSKAKVVANAGKTLKVNKVVGEVKPTPTPIIKYDSSLPVDFRHNVLSHNVQIGVRNSKMGTISGSHQEQAFLESVNKLGAKLVGGKLTDSRFPGIIEYKYQIPTLDPKTQKLTGAFKPTQIKTTYDSRILSDYRVAEMSEMAAKNAMPFFKNNPNARRVVVNVNGYFFEVTKDTKTGLPNNAFLTIPARK